MKSIKSVCILAVLVLSVFFSQAQSESLKGPVPFPYEIAIECDGVLDVLIPDGTVQSHTVDFFDNNGDYKWHKNQVHTTVTSQNTGEKFKVHEINKGDFKNGIWTFHYNMIGNQGTRIHLKGKYNMAEGTLEEEITCK